MRRIPLSVSTSIDKNVTVVFGAASPLSRSATAARPGAHRTDGQCMACLGTEMPRLADGVTAPWSACPTQVEDPDLPDTPGKMDHAVEWP